MNLQITPAAAPRFARAKMWWLAIDAKCPCEGDYCTNPSCDWPDAPFAPGDVVAFQERWAAIGYGVDGTVGGPSHNIVVAYGDDEDDQQDICVPKDVYERFREAICREGEGVFWRDALTMPPWAIRHRRTLTAVTFRRADSITEDEAQAMGHAVAQRFHPGEYLEDELAARGWTTAYCAAKMGGDVAVETLALDLLIAAHHAPEGHAAKEMTIGEESAVMLARAFGISAETWLNLDRAYHAPLTTRFRAENPQPFGWLLTWENTP